MSLATHVLPSSLLRRKFVGKNGLLAEEFDESSVDGV